MAQLKVQATLLLEVNDETGEVDQATIMPQNHGEWVEAEDEWEIGQSRDVLKQFADSSASITHHWEF